MSDVADALVSVGRLLVGRGPAAARYADRISLRAEEFGSCSLPSDLIKADGSLDLYPDVAKLVQVGFKDGKLSAQCQGWLGYIPLNDRYALDVDTRVPVGNIERLIGLASGDFTKVLEQRTRYFAHTTEQADTLFDLLADQLIEAFERLWNEGLVKGYERVTRISTSPSGRIDPFASAWRTAVAGRPTAVSSSYQRTADTAPNRVLLLAFERLLVRYLQLRSRESSGRRLLKIRRVIDRLDGVGRASASDLSPLAMARHVERAAYHHDHYADALRIARLIIADLGIAIRGREGMAVMPSILIDMSKVFEEYARRRLAAALEADGRFTVKSGNQGKPVGAMESLYEDAGPGSGNAVVKPDIVVYRGTEVVAIIDAKYKLPKDLPDRYETEQAVLYGARYGCSRTMLLYAGRKPAKPYVEKIGRVGAYEVHVGRIDLAAADMEAEESGLTDAVRALLG